MKPKSTQTSGRGFITVAIRRRRYLEMAVDMALSLRETNPDPISIVVDPTTRRTLTRHYASIFDHVILLPEAYQIGRAAKYFVGRATPYAYTLVIDADAFVVNSLAGVWVSLRGRAIGLVGAYVRAEDGLLHHGFPVADLMAEFNLERYLKNNGSFFFFEKEAGIEFLDACFDLYREHLFTPERRAQARGWIGDELALAIVGARAGLAPWPGPAPFYWDYELSRLGPNELRRPVVHFLDVARPETVQWLVANARRRRREAGVRDIQPVHWWIESEFSGPWAGWLPRGSQRHKGVLKVLGYLSGYT